MAQTIEGSRSEDLQDVSKLQAKLPEGWGVTGGIARPSTDVKTSKSLSLSGEVVAKVKSLKRPEGGLPIVSADTNEQTKQLAIALKENTRPELQSSFVTLRDFDAEKFKTLGKDYSKLVASEAQPGRVFAPAQPGDGVNALRTNGARMHRLTQGESVSLKVKATPFAPVSFTSFGGGGQFGNSLSSITVVANESGLAQSTFTASSGTKNTVQVMAASPVDSEQVVFSINVKLASN